MSTEAKGSIFQHARGRLVIYIPADVQKDSTFPFKKGDKVNVRIDGKRLVVEKAKEK